MMSHSLQLTQKMITENVAKTLHGHCCLPEYLFVSTFVLLPEHYSSTVDWRRADEQMWIQNKFDSLFKDMTL